MMAAASLSLLAGALAGGWLLRSPARVWTPLPRVEAVLRFAAPALCLVLLGGTFRLYTWEYGASIASASVLLAAAAGRKLVALRAAAIVLMSLAFGVVLAFWAALQSPRSTALLMDTLRGGFPAEAVSGLMVLLLAAGVLASPIGAWWVVRERAKQEGRRWLAVPVLLVVAVAAGAWCFAARGESWYIARFAAIMGYGSSVVISIIGLWRYVPRLQSPFWGRWAGWLALGLLVAARCR